MKQKSLPIGIDSFSKIREKNFYYVDKTGMIIELLQNWGEVNLFTRPRRFGKTLNMSMLKSFFEVGTDKSLFNGLAISREQELCEKHMGKYPVIFLSLKQAKGLNYQEAETQMRIVISLEAIRHNSLEQSDELKPVDKKILTDLQLQQGDISSSILQLSRILYTHYHQKVIILIDEYDVPLQKAEQEGYYKEMVNLMSQFFGSGMKTNPYMEFAVITGCLRVSKESIFTGFNNVKMHTIVDESYDEWFGFTDEEVKEMLRYYGMEDKYALTKAWYDGYLFGNTHVYCPWDVINWCDKVINNSELLPKNFWANSSENDIIHRFADKAEETTKAELEQLLEGKSVWKRLNLELTYKELDDSVENLWSVLLITGYLTYKGMNEKGEYELVIPNLEIKNLFREMIDKWFKEKIIGNRERIKAFYAALDAADADKLERCICAYLGKSISFFDGGKQDEKESFYHGMMLGMLQLRDDWVVLSNREAGEGRPDIVTHSEWGEKAIVFEFKYVKAYEEMPAAAGAALEQIKDRNYDSFFAVSAAEEVTHIGIAFCKKRCKVLIEKK